MLPRFTIALSAAVICLATRHDELKIRAVEDLAAQAESIGPAKISSLVTSLMGEMSITAMGASPTVAVGIAVPKSLRNEILTAVQPSVLLSLLDSDYRSEVASDFHAGHTPGWYETIKPEVKSFFAQFAQHKESLVITQTETPGESGTLVPSSPDVETKPTETVNVDASHTVASQSVKPTDTGATAAGNPKSQESTDAGATGSEDSKPRESLDTGATTSGDLKAENSAKAEAATSAALHADSGDGTAVTTGGSSKSSEFLQTAGVESYDSDIADSSSDKATGVGNTTATTVKSLGGLNSDQTESSTSNETKAPDPNKVLSSDNVSELSLNGSGSSTSGIFKTLVSGSIGKTGVGQVTGEGITKSTATGTKGLLQTGEVSSSTGGKPSSSRKDSTALVTGAPLKTTNSAAKSTSASGSQVSRTVQSVAVAMPTGVDRLTVVGVVGMAGFLGAMMAL